MSTLEFAAYCRAGKPPLEKPKQQPEQVPAHIRRHVSERLEDLAAILGEEVAFSQNELIAKLRAEIDELRVERLKHDDATAEIIDLPALPWRRTG
jgi:hypothetical protein